MAVPPRAAVRQRQRVLHHVGGDQRRVQVDRPGRSGPQVGTAQVQAQHELRQAFTRTPLLLRQEHYDEGARQEVRLQVRLPRTHAAVEPAVGRLARRTLQVPDRRSAVPQLRTQAQLRGSRSGRGSAE